MRLNPECGLLASLVDYAGLFPPAALDLHQAAANYSRYLKGPNVAMLGRFVVPVGRLSDLATVIGEIEPRTSPWNVSVLVGKEVASGLLQITEALARHIESPTVSVRSIEAVAEAAEAMQIVLPPNIEAYFEIDHRDDPNQWIEAASKAGVAAKIRTGGVEAAAFPSAPEIARFILACAHKRVPLKATAGLHHPFPATYPLTYEADGPSGDMHGFMNVFFAAGLAWKGLRDAEKICSILEQKESPSWDPRARQMCWAGHCLSMADLLESRRHFARSYGSCSFLEPIQGLEERGLL